MRIYILLLILLCLIPILAYAKGIYYYAGSGAVTGACAGGSDGLMGDEAIVSAGSCHADTASRLYVFEYTPTEDGTSTYIHYSTYSANGNTAAGIWDENGVYITGCTLQSGTNAQPNNFDVILSQDICLVTGTTYYLGVWVAQDSFADSYIGDVGGGYVVHYINMVTFGSNFNPASLTQCGSSTRQLSCWIDNSATR